MEGGPHRVKRDGPTEEYCSQKYELIRGEEETLVTQVRKARPMEFNFISKDPASKVLLVDSRCLKSKALERPDLDSGKLLGIVWSWLYLGTLSPDTQVTEQYAIPVEWLRSEILDTNSFLGDNIDLLLAV